MNPINLLPDLRESSYFSPASISFLRVALAMGEPRAVGRAIERLDALNTFVEGATVMATRGGMKFGIDISDLHLDRIEKEISSIQAVLFASPEKAQRKAEQKDRDEKMSGFSYSDIYGQEPQWEPVGATSLGQAFRNGKLNSIGAELDKAFSNMEEVHELSLFDTVAKDETHLDRVKRLDNEQHPQTLEAYLGFM